MKQSIRALGWTIGISILILFTFSITAAYSMAQTLLINQGIRLSETPEIFLQNDILTTSYVLTVNNSGFYEISRVNITTMLFEPAGEILLKKSKVRVKKKVKNLENNIENE